MLSIVATPIGNLGDITLRALEALKAADYIACEDTRETVKLLAHYQVPEKRFLGYYEHSPEIRVHEILALVRQGKRVAVVTDGGMPSISDPGFTLIREAIREKAPFEVLPGASAVTTALVASGLAVDEFSFLGFLPNKSAARKKRLARFAEREETLIFFESPFRLPSALRDMFEVFGDREAVVARELTKKFEELLRGRLSELVRDVEKRPRKGEMVVLVSGQGRKKLLS
ncbi:MAG TPA: 16S rRNA (cytidine(1402)-2'-O)-methyltransferase [Candidatus Omnitrophota bacterium]|jgi:16S rRNA (cytidine1402-2'-O)-methyltransferase|nr:MAG: Ribosomal RNA small subunit methyltransferase I [Candidatus Omnitrophica bacterium ADurb.Bin314]HOE68231.1 16S rRNA (cytidine(1402)-2'-O)-methyltransferase [Candidatus Omnitrophota bacterium]HPW64962.1 16S rRNA (cytidine(1402)-2'-O)-methyltransferase [Candidatus Omnitrophota bacterium]HQB94112.1 16S rRNA (cytidine(1402)-2'-O)-methyltransferase [Candidatus Omnitrophota bacterium]